MSRQNRVLVLAVSLTGVLGALETVLYPTQRDTTNMFYGVAQAAVFNMIMCHWSLSAEGPQRPWARIGMLIGGLIGLSDGLHTHGLALHAVFDAVGGVLLGGLLVTFLGIPRFFDRSMWPVWRLAIVAVLVGALLGLGIGLLQGDPPRILWIWVWTGAALLPLLLLLAGPFITWPRLPGKQLGWSGSSTALPKYNWPPAKPIDEATRQAISAEARRHREQLDRQPAEERQAKP